jgi:hypothetical protein
MALITIAEQQDVNDIFNKVIADMGYAPRALSSMGLGDLLAKVGVAVTTDLYVDSVAGSDANPGTTPTSPLRTLDAMVALHPETWTGACRVHLAAGNYDFDKTIYTFGRMLGTSASPLTIIGAETDQLGTLTTIGGTTTTSYVAAVVTTSHTLRGASLRNTATGKQARISDNVFSAPNTTFTLASGQTLTTTVGQQFVVTKPGANLLIPQFGIGGIVGACTVAFENIRFAAKAEAGFELPLLIFNEFVQVNLFNCEIDGGTSNRNFYVGANTQLGASAQATGWANDPTSTVGNTQSGLWYHNAGITAGGVCQAFYNGRMIGNFMLDNGLLIVQNGALQSATLDTTGSSINIYEMSEIQLLKGLMVGSHPLQHDTILIQENSFGTFANPSVGSGTTVTINNSLGNAINFQNSRGHVFVVAGTGNAAAGIVSYMSSVLFDTTHPPTVTGSTPGTNDTVVGTTPKAYSALPFPEAATLSIIQMS